MRYLNITLIVLFLLVGLTTSCAGMQALGNVAVIPVSQPKVVKIGVAFIGEDKRPHKFVGSGALISKDGLILTCGHLFDGRGRIYVKTADGTVYLARMVRLDHNVDLAVIKIDPLGDLPYFKFGPAPIVGQQVLAFGSPLAIQGTVSIGYVSNLDWEDHTLIIHGAALNPGNSGGPLVDRDGRLVGVNVAVLLANPFVPAQGMGLAVKMGIIRRFVGA